MKIKTLQLTLALFFYATCKISAAPPPPPPGIPPPVGLPVDDNISILFLSAIVLGFYAISKKKKWKFFTFFFKRKKQIEDPANALEAVQLIKVKL